MLLLYIAARTDKWRLFEIADVVILVAHVGNLSLVVLFKVNAPAQQNIVKSPYFLNIFDDPMVHHIIFETAFSRKGTGTCRIVRIWNIT